MTTTFDLLIRACGFSRTEAAAYLQVRPDTLKAWAGGRSDPPLAVVTALIDLVDRIENGALVTIDGLHNTLDLSDFDEPPTMELGIARDDHDARSLGWPCLSVHRQVLVRIVTLGYTEFDAVNFVIVPRDSTPATRAARLVRERPQG